MLLPTPARGAVQLWQFAFAPHMAAPMKALLLLLLAASCSSTRSSLFADDEATLSENAKNCIFLYKARPGSLGLLPAHESGSQGKTKYVYALKARRARAFDQRGNSAPVTTGRGCKLQAAITA